MTHASPASLKCRVSWMGLRAMLAMVVSSTFIRVARQRTPKASQRRRSAAACSGVGAGTKGGGGGGLGGGSREVRFGLVALLGREPLEEGGHARLVHLVRALVLD